MTADIEWAEYHLSSLPPDAQHKAKQILAEAICQERQAEAARQDWYKAGRQVLSGPGMSRVSSDEKIRPVAQGIYERRVAQITPAMIEQGEKNDWAKAERQISDYRTEYGGWPHKGVLLPTKYAPGALAITTRRQTTAELGFQRFMHLVS